eukprot:5985500-Amphidinium_carterae.2
MERSLYEWGTSSQNNSSYDRSFVKVLQAKARDPCRHAHCRNVLSTAMPLPVVIWLFYQNPPWWTKQSHKKPKPCNCLWLKPMIIGVTDAMA